MNPQPSSRKEAMATGASVYRTGVPCKRGHLSERATRNGACSACEALRLSRRDRSDEYEARRAKRAENLAAAREQERQYRAETTDHRRAYHRAYQQKRRQDPEVRRQENEASRRRRMSPEVRERDRKNARDWGLRNPQRRAEACARRRARQRNAFVAPVDRAEIFKRDGWRCGICGNRVDPKRKMPHPKAPTIDHIVPLTRGGTHEPRNVQTACYACNVRKGNRSMGCQLLLVG